MTRQGHTCHGCQLGYCASRHLAKRGTRTCTSRHLPWRGTRASPSRHLIEGDLGYPAYPGDIPGDTVHFGSLDVKRQAISPSRHLIEGDSDTLFPSPHSEGDLSSTLPVTSRRGGLGLFCHTILHRLATDSGKTVLQNNQTKRACTLPVTSCRGGLGVS